MARGLPAKGASRLRRDCPVGFLGRCDQSQPFLQWLERNLLVSKSPVPSPCPTRLSEWLGQNAKRLGTAYANELSRHYGCGRQRLRRKRSRTDVLQHHHTHGGGKRRPRQPPDWRTTPPECVVGTTFEFSFPPSKKANPGPRYAPKASNHHTAPQQPNLRRRARRGSSPRG